jgi:PRTRC genetic system protein C
MRTFVYDAMELTDPGSSLTPEAVRTFYAAMYPELTNATVESSALPNGDIQYAFRKAAGGKG